MEWAGAVVVVTGGASGIGRALCRRFATLGASVTVADSDGDAAATVASEVGGTAVRTDVAEEGDVAALVAGTVEGHGRIDLYCSNAGILFGEAPTDQRGWAGVEVSDAGWDRMWRVNLLAHVFAARALLPHWLDRGEGHLLVTASAAGLLTLPGNAPYAVTKHAAVALAEWLALTYGEAGVTVSCLCPEGVRTPMLASVPGSFLAAEALEADTVAAAVTDGIEAGRLLVLPHPRTGAYFARKAADPDVWLAGMRHMIAGLPETAQGKP